MTDRAGRLGHVTSTVEGSVVELLSIKAVPQIHIRAQTVLEIRCHVLRYQRTYDAGGLITRIKAEGRTGVVGSPIVADTIDLSAAALSSIAAEFHLLSRFKIEFTMPRDLIHLRQMQLVPLNRRQEHLMVSLFGHFSRQIEKLVLHRTIVQITLNVGLILLLILH